MLLSRLMELTDVQEGVLNVAFRVADEEGLPLLDLEDLQALLVWVGQNAKALSLQYGNVSVSSVGAIQRQLLVLENQGGAALFGEPALELADLMRKDADGNGQINIMQHALRAFTAKDRKELKLAAQTYRDNPAFETAAAIQEVGTGEAVTSLLDAKGIPQMVERTLIRPPSSQLGPITKAERAAVMQASPMSGKYDTKLDRDSAAEMLAKRAAAAAEAAEKAEEEEERLEAQEREFKAARRYDGQGTSLVLPNGGGAPKARGQSPDNFSRKIAAPRQGAL